MKIIGIIPARYQSSRFPGKPLADIHGKPMIWWVFQNAKKVQSFAEIYIATEDERIENVCKKYGMPVVMTSDKHPTGTDRIGEVASKYNADVYVNIQGDEPMIEPKTIEKAIEPFILKQNYEITNLMTQILDPVDLINCTVPKVVVNSYGEAVFLSRSPIPYPKGNLNIKYYKQVCVYGFTPKALEFFCSKQKGPVEKAEDIELLRFIENNRKVKMIEVESSTVAVDTEKDLEKVRVLLQV
jgi:3-deoxy-manno-octulosonate cytidylyltransferase (CMP-KDO synthetase)